MSEFPKENINDAAAGLRAIAHEVRLSILCDLAVREMNVSEMVEVTGATQSSISQHLAKMRALKIIAAERRGMEVYYRLAEPGFKRIIKALKSIYCEEKGTKQCQ